MRESIKRTHTEYARTTHAGTPRERERIYNHVEIYESASADRYTLSDISNSMARKWYELPGKTLDTCVGHAACTQDKEEYGASRRNWKEERAKPDKMLKTAVNKYPGSQSSRGLKVKRVPWNIGRHRTYINQLRNRAFGVQKYRS